MSLAKDVLVKQITTANATPTNVTAAAVTVGDDREATFLLHAVARSGANVKGFHSWGVAKRPAAGALAAVGTILAMVTAQGDTALAAAIITVVASGNDLVPQVTGIAATITWDVWFEVYRKP